MDPAQGETGGKSLTSKFKAKAPHSSVRDKVKSLKSRLPGMKKRSGGDEEGHEDTSSEYDEGSPRSPGPETGYNVGESTPLSTAKTNTVSQDPNSPSYERTSPREAQSRDYDSRPSQISPSAYDTQNRNYVAAAPPTRPAPMATDSPRSNLAPSMEEKFKYLDIGEKSPLVVNPPTDRSYHPEQQFSPSVTNSRTDPIPSYQPEQQFSPSVTNPRTDPIRSYQPEQQYSPSVTNSQTDPIRSYQPEQQYSPSVTNSQTDPIRSYQPEQQYSPSVTNPQTDPIRNYMPEQQYSPSTTESIQKGYSDVPRNSYRASPTTPTNKGMVDKVKESVSGAAAVLGDKMGYYNDTPAAPRDPNAPSILDKAKSTLGLDKPRDPNAPSVVDKTKATLGLDKPGDPNAPPLTEKAKVYMSMASQKTREYSATAADHANWTKDRVAAHTTPTHHDKALSEQVTQTLSTLPGAIREKVFGPASPSTNNVNSPRTPGIADRVSGAMNYLFTAAPQQTAERLQHTFPAHSDYHGQPTVGSVPQNFADRNIAEERMPATSTPAYPPTYPMVNS